MAAPKTKPTKLQQDQTRAAIQTTQLIKRLQNFALGKDDVEIDPPRIKAMEILLRKSLPDLSAVQMDANLDISDPMKELLGYVAQKGARLGS